MEYFFYYKKRSKIQSLYQVLAADYTPTYITPILHSIITISWRRRTTKTISDTVYILLVSHTMCRSAMVDHFVKRPVLWCNDGDKFRGNRSIYCFHHHPGQFWSLWGVTTGNTAHIYKIYFASSASRNIQHVNIFGLNHGSDIMI